VVVKSSKASDSLYLRGIVQKGFGGFICLTSSSRSRTLLSHPRSFAHDNCTDIPRRCPRRPTAIKITGRRTPQLGSDPDPVHPHRPIPGLTRSSLHCRWIRSPKEPAVWRRKEEDRKTSRKGPGVPRIWAAAA
jgi:hypothetical protein